jgi:hypothetical protein
MKQLLNFFIILCTVLFFSCIKEDLNNSETPFHSDLKAKSPVSIRPKDFRLKTLTQEVTHQGSSFTSTYTYHFHYNNNGLITRIDKSEEFLGLTNSFYTNILRTGSRIDSVVQILDNRLGQAHTNIRYSGNKIIQSVQWNLREYDDFRFLTVSYKYDKKGKLLNSDPSNEFIYNNDGILTRVINHSVPLESYSFTHENSPNPLFIEYLFLYLISYDLIIKEHSYSELNTTKKVNDRGEAVTYINKHDDIGRLIRKDFEERGTKFSMYYTYY